MDTRVKTALFIVFAVVTLLLLFGGRMMTGTSDGMMGIGSMGGSSWTWLPTLLVFALGVLLFSVISGKK